jgi:mycoredoxin
VLYHLSRARAIGFEAIIGYAQVSPLLHGVPDTYGLFAVLDQIVSPAEPRWPVKEADRPCLERATRRPDDRLRHALVRRHTGCRYLDRLGMPYRYVGLDTAPAAKAQLRWCIGGFVSHPTVYIGEEILVEPTPGELQWVIWRGVL